MRGRWRRFSERRRRDCIFCVLSGFFRATQLCVAKSSPPTHATRHSEGRLRPGVISSAFPPSAATLTRTTTDPHPATVGRGFWPTFSAPISTRALVAAGLCAGSRSHSPSPLSPGSWLNTAWGQGPLPTCPDLLRASSLYRSRADLEPFAHDGSLDTPSVRQTPFAAPVSEPQSAGPQISSAISSRLETSALPSCQAPPPSFCFTS